MKYCFARFPGGRPKAVTLSYDDGVKYDLELAKIIGRYGMKCTFNINSGSIARENGQYRLSAQEISEYLLKQGHEAAIHGERHNAPGKCRKTDLVKEVLFCRMALEKQLGRIIRGMAYPDSGITVMQNGADYESIREILSSLGVVYARTLGGDNNGFLLPTDWYAWMPTVHHKNPQALEFAKEFTALDCQAGYPADWMPRLFYLWGHSYEFHEDGNWELLISLCEELSGREDTWYATNMEIYDYMAAYQSLVFSADDTMIYNPTLKEIWFNIDGEDYHIKAGETLQIKG